jgi:hypothetical protein
MEILALVALSLVGVEMLFRHFIIREIPSDGERSTAFPLLRLRRCHHYILAAWSAAQTLHDRRLRRFGNPRSWA